MDRIKDLYQANEITDNGQLIGLQKWYNRVIMKQPDELDLKDVSIMIRQRLFLETAVNKAVTFLEEDPLVGEMYPGQLLINLSCIPSSDYVQYRGKLLRIIDNALECIVINDDITEEEKDDILTSIRKINDTLMENI